VFFVAVAILFIDRAGRRVLMLIGIAGMALSTFLLAAMFQVNCWLWHGCALEPCPLLLPLKPHALPALQIKESQGHITTNQGWVALVALFSFMGFYEISLGYVEASAAGWT
jgi:hypothetical protein